MSWNLVAVGNWSKPYGVWGETWNAPENNAMAWDPVVYSCPLGRYATEFYVKPSQWYTVNRWTGSTWVGTISMRCNDGSVFTIDAQPDIDPGFQDGNFTREAGAAGLC